MKNPLYDYSAIARRPPLTLPGGARLALWFGVAIEHYPWGKPGSVMVPYTAELVPDPMNYGWRDYGPRVGAFRLMDIMSAAGIPVTGIVNSDACGEYPELIEEAVAARLDELGRPRRQQLHLAGRPRARRRGRARREGHARRSRPQPGSGRRAGSARR